MPTAYPGWTDFCCGYADFAAAAVQCWGCGTLGLIKLGEFLILGDPGIPANVPCGLLGEQVAVSHSLCRTISAVSPAAAAELRWLIIMRMVDDWMTVKELTSGFAPHERNRLLVLLSGGGPEQPAAGIPFPGYADLLKAWAAFMSGAASLCGRSTIAALKAGLFVMLGDPGIPEHIPELFLDQHVAVDRRLCAVIHEVSPQAAAELRLLMALALVDSEVAIRDLTWKFPPGMRNKLLEMLWRDNALCGA